MRASILITPPALLLAGACLLAGCGQKGPLYLPPEPPTQKPAPVVTSPAREGSTVDDITSGETGAADGQATDTARRKGPDK